MAGSNPFEVRGTVTVVDSAVVLCARRRPSDALTLGPRDVGAAKSKFLRGNALDLFGEGGEVRFESGWEVLLGQSEVVNWLRSEPGKLRLMRYPGEWKIPGGNADPGETVAQCARREFVEEFLHPVAGTTQRPALPDTAVLRPFAAKQTRPIRSRSNLMHCFVALEEENPWLRDFDVGKANAALAERRKRFADLATDADGETPSERFWALPRAEREAVTPEVREVRWMPLRDAVGHALSSFSPGTFVNEYQRAAFAKVGRKGRDPMFITAAILMELEGFPNAASLVRHCESVDLGTLIRKEQWIHTGMDAEAVDAAFALRAGGGLNPSFKSPRMIAQLRRERAGEAEERSRRASRM